MRKIVSKDSYKNYRGEIEIIFKDKNGRVVKHIVQENLIKVFAKEILSKALPYSKIWNPTGGSGSGAWEDRTSELYDDFAPKYILLGASYDDAYEPLGKSDTRFYTYDNTTATYTAVTPEVGADNMGDLINPIPISEPTRPLKRIEAVSFSSSYQPSDTPLLDDTVRAMNNVVSFETTLTTSEYNGIGGSATAEFTITEVALAGGKELDTSIGACECAPHILFLEGTGGVNDDSIPATAFGTTALTLTGTVADINSIQIGDQIMIVAETSSTETYDTLGQVNPYYLVVDKMGASLTLDRTPTSATTGILSGSVGVYRSSLRLFSHRVLDEPVTKSSVYEIVLRWNIYMS